MKKTKIVCTIGPASETKEILVDMIKSGMNVARLNFSHGTHEEHKKRIDVLKLARREAREFVGILLDTKGPEIRTGDFSEKEVWLKEGQDFTLTVNERMGDYTGCSVSYKNLPQDVSKGSRILIDDGLIELEVVTVDGEDVKCVVRNGGIIKNHKGVNIPGIQTSLPAITQKDYDDILFGIENGIDYIAASFVRKAADVQQIKGILDIKEASRVKIIAKIENQEGVDNLDEILEVADGIMVARGDLGVEIETEKMPLVQKEIIRKCNLAGKPVITATQMLDSMSRNPRPTRAEVTDVANAILDGTDAIMLSGETAAGRYPVEAVRTMDKIAMTTEDAIDYEHILSDKSFMKDQSITDAIGHATCECCRGLHAKSILIATKSGYTARMVSKFRPESMIVAATIDVKVASQMTLVWGVLPAIIKTSSDSIEIFDLALEAALEGGYIEDGDLIVITAGVPVGKTGKTNMMKIHVVGENTF